MQKLNFDLLKTNQQIELCCMDCGVIRSIKFKRSRISQYKNYRCHRCANFQIKNCRMCKKHKPKSEFLKFKDGWNPICNECWKFYESEFDFLTSSKKIHNRLSKIKYYNKNKSKILIKKKEIIESSFSKFLATKLLDIKSNSNRTVDDDVDLNYLIEIYHSQYGCCAISDIPLAHKFGKPNSISIDRINSNLEYVRDNIQLVCQFINLGKNRFNNDDIITFIDNLVFSKTRSKIIGTF